MVNISRLNTGILARNILFLGKTLPPPVKMPGINSGYKPGWRCIVRTTTIHCVVRRDNDNDTDVDGDDADDDQSEGGLMSTICRFYRQWTIRDFRG